MLRPDHLHFRCADPEAAAAFWVGVMGAEELWRGAKANGAPRVRVRLGGLELVLDGVPAGHPAMPRPMRGLEHLGLAVQGIHEVAATLRARGATLTLEPLEAEPGVWIAFVEGPDGVVVELIERLALS